MKNIRKLMRKPLCFVIAAFVFVCPSFGARAETMTLEETLELGGDYVYLDHIALHATIDNIDAVEIIGAYFDFVTEDGREGTFASDSVYSLKVDSMDKIFDGSYNIGGIKSDDGRPIPFARYTVNVFAYDSDLETYRCMTSYFNPYEYVYSTDEFDFEVRLVYPGGVQFYRSGEITDESYNLDKTMPVYVCVDAQPENSNFSGTFWVLQFTRNEMFYEVKAGDTLGTIALNHYGSYKYHTQIYDANKELIKSAGFKPGLVLYLPQEGLLAPLKTNGVKEIYTARQGDTLAKIAELYYNNDYTQWKKLFEFNKERITDYNSIYEGQWILIPAE